RAALLTKATIEYLRRLQAGKLALDELHGSPIDSTYRKWLFHAIRKPGSVVDAVKRFDFNRNIIVLRRGHIFQITFPEAHEVVQTSALYQTFQNIINTSQESLPAVSSFTADDRQSWAQRHAELAKQPANSETLAAIDCCAFVVCLDTESPVTASERHMQFLLNGTDANLANRWLDKPFQLVITANGASAGVFEHSKLDGMDVRALHHYLSEIVPARATNQLLCELPPKTPAQMAYPLQELRWELSPDMIGRIDQIQRRGASEYGTIDHVKVVTEGLGSQYLQGCGVPPNATANLTVLLAMYMVDKEVRPAWEVVSLARFKHGRIDWVQTVTSEVKAFLEAAVARPDDLQKSNELFRAAASTHARLIMNTAYGRGYVKHMYTL
ncbi:acyltransferase ChoActase/COT/CPT, partial [Coniella lustricola]